MKVLRILLICFSLYWTQVHAPVLATDTSPDTSSIQFNPSHGSADDTEDATADSEANIQDGLETGGFVKSSILLFAVVFAGITIAKSCLRRASSAVFLVTAFIYVASEIALFSGFYHDGAESLNSYEAQDYDEQVESLREASDQADKASKVAIAKAVVQALVVLGFVVAAVIAIIESVFDWPKFTGDCFAQNDRQKNDLEYYAMITPGFQPSHYIQSAKNDVEALIRLEEMGRFINGERSSMDLQTAEAKSFQFSLASLPDIKPLLNVSANFFANAFFPSAQAGDKGGAAGAMIAALGIGAIAGAAITSSMAGTLGASYAGMMSSGYVRAAVYGVFAGIATWSAAESGVVADELKSNATEYDRLADQISRLTTETESFNAQGSTTAASQHRLPPGGPDAPEQEKLPPTTCFEGKSLADDVQLDSDCSCRETNTCTKSQLPALSQGRPDVPGGSALSDAANSLTRSADAIFSGDINQARLEGENAAQLAARLKKNKAEYIDLANEKIKASGGKPIDDWDELEKKTEQRLIDEVNTAFSKLSDKERAALAKLAPGIAKSKTAKKDSKSTDKSKEKTKKASSLASLGGKGKSYKNKGSGNNGFEFLDEEGKKKRKKIARKLASEKDSKDKSAKSKGKQQADAGIAGRDQNLFQLITKRYKKSAYRFFFGEDEDKDKDKL